MRRASTVAALSLLTLSACSARRQPADELLIASPHRDEIREEMERGFRAWYARENGREVRPIWLDLGGSSNIQKYITDRLSSGSTAGVDVFFGGGTDPFETLKRQENLVAYKLPEEILSYIPAEIHGLPIYESKRLDDLVRAFGITDVVVSSEKVADSRLTEIRDLGVTLRRMRITIE